MVKLMTINKSTLVNKIDLYCTNILNKSQRIFTALDRDPDSPTCGCYDRDYWHYKIRDFSSMILHQASLTTEFLHGWNNDKNIFYDKPVLKTWLYSSLNHWCNVQLKNGSFNEYYPCEEGYPPTAFSLYATSLLVLNKEYQNNEVLKHVEKTCQWILNNPEREASNQEAIGISAVYLSSRINGVKVSHDKLDKRFQEFFDSQDKEGWFPEYNGPDIGYLSVTIDALWDYYRYSKDKRALTAMKKAADFVELFFTNGGNLPVMINSRNTDYVVPYGIFNLATLDDKYLSLAYKVLKKITDPFNYLEATDDRYLCHYIFTSSARAIEALEKLKDKESIILNKLTDYNLSNSGIVIKNINNNLLYINTKKGGMVYIYDENNLIYTNHGFRYVDDKTIGVTHWLTEDNTIKAISGESNISIKGNFISRKWLVPTPFKHIVLRAITYIIGKKIIPLLKSIFIFGDKKLNITFDRQIIFSHDSIEIIDSIESKELSVNNIKESPYYSLRHVSSAVRFAPDELSWNNNKYITSIQKENNKLISNISIGLK